jgi:5-dehydro-4-deoxyglucarate dehydratase
MDPVFRANQGSTADQWGQLRRALDGVHNYLPTPFRRDLSVDIRGLRENVAYYARTASRDMTITVGGGYGEGHSLDLEEHRAVVRAAVEGAAGRLPIMAGVIGGYKIAHRMALNAQEAGAGSVIVFFPPASLLSEENAYNYFRALAEELEIGVVAFPRGEHPFWPSVLERLAQIPNVIGFVPPGSRDGKLPLKVGKAVASLVPERLIWIAENEPAAMEAFPFESRAYTTAVAAIVPKASRKFWKNGVARNWNKMRQVFKESIEPIIAIRGLRPGYGISGIKVAMELLGLAGGPVRPPYGTQVSATDREAIGRILLEHPETKQRVQEYS